MPVSPRWGWSVYFVQTDSFADKVKIGVTHNLEHRLRTFQTASPDPFVVMHQIMCDTRSHAERLERELHARFDPWRHRGEWFQLAEPLAKFLTEDPPYYCICRECHGLGDLQVCQLCSHRIAPDVMFVQQPDGDVACSECLAKLAKSSRKASQEKAHRLMSEGHWRTTKAA